MKNLFYKILFEIYVYTMLYHNYKIWGYAAVSPKSIGKYQLAFANSSQFKVVFGIFYPLSFTNLEVQPNEVIFENDGQSLIIQMKYDVDKVPLLSIDLESYEYRFEYMYFQWLQKVPAVYNFENIRFPGELHVVFYNNKKFKDFGEALDFNEEIVVLAFGIKAQSDNSSYPDIELLEGLKKVTAPETEAFLDNFALSNWLNVSLSYYCQYVGTVSLLNSPTKAFWFDMFEPIQMSTALIKEFKVLKNGDGKSLINQPQPVVMEKVTKIINCNRQPYYEEVKEIQENSSERLNNVAFLIALTQMSITAAGF